MSQPRITLQGDRAQQELLAPVLEWATERIAAVVGGCGSFSARSELVAEAWGIAGDGRDPCVAWRVHRRVLPPSSSAEMVGRLDVGPAVLQLDAGDPQLAELVGGQGLTMPLVTLLRMQGRIAGLIWLCRDARSAIDQRESARELRGVLPLLELTHRTGAAAHVHALGELADMGLTARELAVARLALGGESNPAIAERLGISESTVKKHMSRVLAKCGVRSRTQLIALVGDVKGR